MIDVKVELCRNDEHIMAKMYKCVLKFEIEEHAYLCLSVVTFIFDKK